MAARTAFEVDEGAPARELQSASGAPAPLARRVVYYAVGAAACGSLLLGFAGGLALRWDGARKGDVPTGERLALDMDAPEDDWLFNYQPGGYDAMKPDTSVLKWHTTPVAGRVVDGTLTVMLDPFDESSPTLELGVQMWFAKKQPARNGPMLIHCGGPGSDKGCAADYASGDTLEFVDYDVWSISQRGMGDNTPSLLCHSDEDSRLPESCPPGGCKVSDFTTCECALHDGTPMIGEIWTDVDPKDETQVRGLLTSISHWGPKCYASNKFQLHGANDWKYNFLDYVGTQFLAYDIDAFRRAIGAPKMSIFGMSYGTYVGAVYSTIFHDYTHRVVLDGNMSPWPQKDEQSTGDASANDKAIAKLLQNCQRNPDKCALSNPEEDYMNVVNLARERKLTAPTASGEDFALTVGMLMAYFQAMYVDNTGLGFPECTRTIARLLRGGRDRSKAVANILDGFCVVKGTPTWYHYDVCVGPGQTIADEGAPYASTYFEQCAVWSVDQAGLYRVEDAMGAWATARTRHGEAGLAAVIGDLAGTSFWPAVATPTSAIGNPELKILVVGNLFDTATSYGWSQQMRGSFPNGALLTWQGVGHCLPSATNSRNYDPDAIELCHGHIRKYLQEGQLPLDGFTCRASWPLPV